MRWNRQRGSAIVMVVLVLVALMAVAVPFAVTMSQAARESRQHMNQLKAKLIADGSIAHGMAWLYRTNDQIEEDPAASYGGPWTTPEFDTSAEFRVGWEHWTDRDAVRRLAAADVSFSDPHGAIWHTRIDDEQGKVNVISAPPVLIGNLLAGSTLAARIDPGTTALPLLDDPGLPHDGDPNTCDGVVFIGYEPAPYYHADGSTVLVRRIRWAHRNPHSHPEGTPVYDGRGAMISDLGRSGKLRTVADIRRLSQSRIAGLAGGNAALQPEEYERLRRHLTVESWRYDDSGWFKRQDVLGTGAISPGYRLPVRDADSFGPGTRVRFVRREGGTLGTGYVRHVRRRGRRRDKPEHWVITFERHHPFDGDDRTEFAIEAELKHPINVNTARYEVLQAVFRGLSLRNRKRVTSQQASALAAFLISSGAAVAGPESFRKALEAYNRDSRYGGRFSELRLSEDQRLAIYYNATEPNSRHLDFSTTTFCYKSYGTYRIEGGGVVNSHRGLELARHIARQTVAMPSAMPGVVELRSQRDFHSRMAGSRYVVSAPNPLQDWNYGADESEEDDIGGVRLEAQESTPPDNGIIEHFRRERPRYKLTVEGAGLTAGGSVELPLFHTAAGFGTEQARLQRPFGGGYLNPRYDRVSPGFFEMWVQPGKWRSGRHYFFDVGEEDDRNRISFYYDAREGDVVLEIWDANLYGRSSQYRFHCNMENGTWYNVGAAYKGTGPRQMAVRVDDRVRGTGLDGDRVLPGARLATPLGLDEELLTEISVEDPANLDEFPDTGAIIIDHEIFEYHAKTGSGFDQVRRAACFTSIGPHEAGALIRPHGYVNPLSNHRHNRLYHCTATVAGPIDSQEHMSTRINKPKTEDLPGGIDEVTSVIPVQSTEGFQEQGILRIDNEFIYYGKKTEEAFEECVRGIYTQGRLGEPAPHKHRERVRLYSIQITNGTNYPRPPVMGREDAVVSLQPAGGPPEWVEYGWLDERDGKTFLVRGFHRDRDGRGREHWDRHGHWRGARGTKRQDHEGPGDVQVLPVVRVDLPWCGDEKSPVDVDVSILDGNGNGERARIAHVHAGRWGHAWDRERRIHTAYHERFCVSLREPTENEYLPADGARIHKFPANELPTSLPERITIGRDRNGGGAVRARIDEVKFVPDLAPAGWLLTHHPQAPLQPQANRLAVALYGNGRLPPSGAVQVNDEIIYYGELTRGSRVWKMGPQELYDDIPDQDPARFEVVHLSDLERGILGTRPEAHTSGAPVMVFDALPVTRLANLAMMKQDRIALEDARCFPPDGGYARINNEIVGYSHRSGNDLTGCEPLHGRFGTAPGNHAPGSIVQSLPFRFHDRAAETYDGDDLAYFQFAHNASGAVWESLEWTLRDTVGTGGANAITTRALVRFDGKPNWDERPTNRRGGLWEVTGTNSGGSARFGHGVRADRIEVRIFFAYTRGAYRYSAHTFGAAVDDWKSNAEVDTVRLEYVNPMGVKRHEIIEK